MPQIADRLKNLPPYVFTVIAEQIRQLESSGIDVIRLDMGSPDLPPPEWVVQALKDSADKSNTHSYSGYKGTPAFRKAIAAYYQRRFNVSINPDTEVLPLIGSKEGIINLTLAYIDRGDTVLVPAVGYPAYAMGVRLAGGDIYWVDMPEENNFMLDLDSIPEEVAQKAKLLWVNYPNNPTGAVASYEDYEKIVAFCKKYDILLASDNPYVDVTFDNFNAPSILQVPDARSTSLEFVSFSKTYNMAGWRLGAAVGNATAIKTLLQVKSNVDSGHFIPVYDGGIAAIEQTTPEWLSERNAIYRKRRDLIFPVLSEIGLSAGNSKGSLYLWAKVLDMSVEEYVHQALTQAHVSFVPGEAYGPGGESYLRISLSTPEDRIQEALERLKSWYANR